MALGWVLTEGLAVDPDSGEVFDLTIRSFGILRAKSTPPIHVELVDDPGAPRARASDAVFAAVAAATWNAVSEADGTRPESFPARDTRAAAALRR
jgi:CO/xanthine dehydrogenase Mo-binding subunit